MSGEAVHVDIVLTTYNGAAYLPELIDSLERQTFEGWRLVVRDDGSTDDTVELLRSAEQRLGRRVRLIADDDGNLGVVGGFSRVLEAATAPYVMCSDQDDVWLPHKVEATLGKLREVESARGENRPVLVFTDLEVVDETLAPVHPSFWALEKSDPTRVSTKELLTRGRVTGCTVMINRALRDLAVPIPAEAPTHDWWLSLVASLLGTIDHLDDRTILYRQHGLNSLGAKDRTLLGQLRRVGTIPRELSRLRALGAGTRAQAGALARRARGLAAEGRASPDPEQLDWVERYAALARVGELRRKGWYLRNRAFSDDPLTAVAKLICW